MSNDDTIKDLKKQIADRDALLNRVLKLIGEGQGNYHLEVNGPEADDIANEIGKLFTA
jgi:hypothetical protein